MSQVKLIKWQLDVATDPHRFKIICAGRRAGKSVLSRLIVLKWATEEPIECLYFKVWWCILGIVILLGVTFIL